MGKTVQKSDFGISCEEPDAGDSEIDPEEDEHHGAGGDNAPVDPVTDILSSPRDKQRDGAVPCQVRKDVPGEEGRQTDESELHGNNDISQTDGTPPDDPVRVRQACQNTRRYRTAPRALPACEIKAEVPDPSQHVERHPEEHRPSRNPHEPHQSGPFDHIGEPHNKERDQGYLEKSVAQNDQRTGPEASPGGFTDGHGQDRPRHQRPRKTDNERGYEYLIIFNDKTAYLVGNKYIYEEGDSYDWKSLHHIWCVSRSPFTEAVLGDGVLGSLIVLECEDIKGHH